MPYIMRMCSQLLEVFPSGTHLLEVFPSGTYLLEVFPFVLYAARRNVTGGIRHEVF